MIQRHLLIAALALSLPGAALADECRITVADAYLGADAAGNPGAFGLEARVDAYSRVGLLGTLGGSGLSDVGVQFFALAPGISGEIYLGAGVTDGGGQARFDLASSVRRQGATFVLQGTGANGSPVNVSMGSSTWLQVIARATGAAPGDCDGGEIYDDVYGSLYFRHPDDVSPILFSDVDDTLFNSADIEDFVRIMLLNHYQPIDSAVVTATNTWRRSGGVLIGLTAQPLRQRPLTRSEMLFWGFDQAYTLEAHNYTGAGYDGTYKPRTLSYIANGDYAQSGGLAYDFDHCAFKADMLDRFVATVLGADPSNILGLIGDTQSSDGCASFDAGLHWYALMEGDDEVDTSTGPRSDPPPSADAYTEFHGGWSEALPVLCADAGLSCR